MDKNKEWRQIEEYPNYFISEYGDIWSKKINNTMALYMTHKGYRRICLCKNSKYKNFMIHALVLNAFVGPRPNGYHAAHNDGDKLNNHYTNLRWATPKENNRDKFKHGTIQFGENHHQAKLNWEKVDIIRNSSFSRRELARMFNVNYTTIELVQKNITWNLTKKEAGL